MSSSFQPHKVLPMAGTPLLFLLLSPGCAFRAASDDVEVRISALLARMTLEEKLGQLQQLDGKADGAFRPEHPDLVRKGLVGSFLNVRRAARTNELQRIALEESRLKIPLLFAFGVIHGYRTIFPVPLAEAATWDPEAVERAAAIGAREASAAGVKWTFAPMVDIARDPRWGRIVEGAGEDPCLASLMAAARVRGFQGEDFSAPERLIACVKHWVAYGAAEAGRDYNTTDLSERTLREVYFPPFRAAVEAGVGSFMTAFNDLNGVPATANVFLLRDVLRAEWHFEGPVVSDYTSVEELIAHGLAPDGAAAARAALTAGTDVEMVSRLYARHVPQLVQKRNLSMEVVDEAVRRVLRLKFRPRENSSAGRGTGLPCVGLRPSVLLEGGWRLPGVPRYRDGRRVRRLPLDKNVNSLAVIGPLADDPRAPLGPWTGDGRPEDVVTILEGIRAAVSRFTRVTFARGCEVESETCDGLAEAVQAARDADGVVLVAGEGPDMSGEAASRASLDLPGRQRELIQALLATGRPLVLVLMHGRPLTLEWEVQHVPAILEAWFPGTQAGHAVADVLFGEVNPSGRLPVTFPRHVGQVPLYYNHKNTGRPPAEQKYTSKYLDVPTTPLFPFGYGLSYTEFRYANLQVVPTRVPLEGAVTVRVEVENIGMREGEEVTQLYLRDVAASVTRPVKELKGFQRIRLEPGERRRVTFTMRPSDLAFLGPDLRSLIEPGEFRVFVGPNSAEGLEATFFYGVGPD